MYLTNRFYIVFVLVILFLGSGYAFAPLFVVGQWALVALIALVSADGFLLYRTNAIQAERHCADRFSNGDENEVAIRVENSYPRPVSLEIIDEIPFIFQQRNINFRIQPVSYTHLSDDELYYFLDLIDEYYSESGILDAQPDEDGYVDIDLEEVVAYIVKEAKKDEMGEYDPEEVLFVVQGEMEYGDSLGQAD